MAGVYRSSPRSSSGGRYHSVITLLVYGRLDENTKIVLVYNFIKWRLKKEFTGVVCTKKKLFTSLQSYTAERDQSLLALFGP